MKHFFTTLLGLCLVTIFQNSLLAQPAQIIEELVLEEDFEDNLADANLFPGTQKPSSFITGSNSTYLNFTIQPTSNNYISAITFFSLHPAVVNKYDSLLITYDVINNPTNGASELCSSNFGLLAYKTFMPIQSIMATTNHELNIPGISKCEKPAGTQFISTITHKQNDGRSEIIRGEDKFLTLITINNQSVCANTFDYFALVNCVCQTYAPVDQSQQSLCMSMLMGAGPQSLNIGFDNIKIIGYRTDVTTNLTEAQRTNISLVMITNLLGQQVNSATPGQVYLYHYSNGEVVKRIQDPT